MDESYSGRPRPRPSPGPARSQKFPPPPAVPTGRAVPVPMPMPVSLPAQAGAAAGLGIACGSLSALFGVGTLLVILINNSIEHSLGSSTAFPMVWTAVILLDLALAVPAVVGAARLLRGAAGARLPLDAGVVAFGAQAAVWFVGFCRSDSYANPLFIGVPLVMVLLAVAALAFVHHPRTSSWLVARGGG